MCFGLFGGGSFDGVLRGAYENKEEDGLLERVVMLVRETTLEAGVFVFIIPFDFCSSPEEFWRFMLYYIRSTSLPTVS